MSPLFYVAAALSLSAIAITVYAFLSAPQGFEDRQGFHAIRPRVAPEPPATQEKKPSDPLVHSPSAH